MQVQLNNMTQLEKSKGETIAFFGDLVSIDPKDADVHLSVIEYDTLFSYVKEHKESNPFTMMYPNNRGISEDLQKEILSINPHTHFMEINNIEEFTNYYDNGSKEIDRELHPVESVKMLARQDVLFYDVKEREKLEVKVEVAKPKEYIKPTDISLRESISDLQKQIREDCKPIEEFDKEKVEKIQKFLDTMGLKGYDASDKNVQRNVDIQKVNLNKEFSRDYLIPITGKTAVENIKNVIPGTQVKDAKDGLEVAYDLVADKDSRHLKIEYDCKSLGDCHIKGVYREFDEQKSKEEAVDENSAENIEQTKTLFEKIQAEGKKTDGVVLENNASKSYDEMVSNASENIEDQTNTYDPTIKAQEIVDSLNLPEYDNSIDNNNSIDY